MRLRPLAVALIAPLLLAGCGAGRGGAGQSGAEHGGTGRDAAGGHAAAAGHSVALTLEEYRILPQTVSVPAGRLTIVAHNRGILTHNVAVERGNLDSSERVILATVHTLLPGASESIETQPLAPGRYLLVSTIGNQAVLGMSGTLIVR